MIIDSHAHACGIFLRVENIISTLDQNKIDKVILTPGELYSDKDYNIPNIAKFFPNKDVIKFTNTVTKFIMKLTSKIEEIKVGNEYVYSLVKKYPDRIMQFYWVVLNSSEPLLELERNLDRWNFKGIKLHQCWENFEFNSVVFQEVSKFAEEKSLPIFIHAYSIKDVHDLIKHISKNPQTIFIIAHLFGIEHYINSDCNYENTYFEISSPQLISENRLMAAINHFGPEKIIFGSDIPYGKNNQELNISRIMNLNISVESKERILGNNIKKILNLKTT